MLTAREIRDNTVEELQQRLASLRRELYDFVNEVERFKKNEKPHLIKHKRTEIARVMTVLRAKTGRKVRS